MSVPRFCLRRPVMTTLLAFSVTLFGTLAFRGLPVSYLPNVDFPTITVSASYPGASPEIMAAAVATPLEQQFSAIEGLTSMSSSSDLGATQITLQFTLDRSIDSCALDVMSAINAAQRDLPSDLPNPPTFRKINPSLTPVMIFSLHSKTIPLIDVDNYAETLLAERMTMVEGVAEVTVFGSQKRAVRVKADPRQLAARGLGLSDLEAVLTAGNVNSPAGSISGPDKVFTLDSNARLSMAEAYRGLVVTAKDGNVLRLGDLAQVVDGPENKRSGSWLNDEPAISLAVRRQPGANTVAVAEGIKAIMPELKALVPAGIEFDLRYDASLPMIDSVREVVVTILQTVVLVTLITYVFLRNLTATVIPSLALPISLLATGLVFKAFGFSVDTLSLLALTLAVGFVTDDAVVVLENIHRKLEAGRRPMPAAAEGATEISFSIIGMTLSLAAVFIPFLLMGGVIGRLFSDFSVVITTAILISGVVSLTLTPLLCAKFLRPGVESGPVARVCERFLTRLNAAYATSLRAALNWPRAMLALGGLMMVTTGWLLYSVPKDFLPAPDNGMISVNTEADQGTSYDRMVRLHARASQIIRQNPDVSAAVSVLGSSRNTINNGSFNVILKDLAPAGPRRHSADEVAQALRASLAGLPGLLCYPSPPPAVQFGSRSSRSLYQLTLSAQDTGVLYPAADKLLAALQARPELTDVDSDLQMRDPTLNVVIDRDKASSLGVTAGDILTVLNRSFSDHQVSTILASNDQYEVILEVEDRFQTHAQNLDAVYIQAGGRVMPLSTLAHWESTVGPMVVNHSQQLPSVTLSFNPAPNVALGAAVEAASGEAARLLPSTVAWGFQGTAQVFADTVSGMLMLLVLAVMVIYVILGVLYESYWHPLTILSGLPAAATGGLLTLAVFGRALDIYGMLGLVLLIGLVKKNAILVVDFALRAMRDGQHTALEAAYEGSLARFRPILMTTLAALAAGILISTAGGRSGDSRRALGLVLSGGLIVSQIITLYLTPVIFQYMETFRHWLASRRAD